MIFRIYWATVFTLYNVYLIANWVKRQYVGISLSQSLEINRKPHSMLEDMMIIPPSMIDMSGFVGDNAFRLNIYRWTDM